MEWIPCTERLPEKSGRYLVTRGPNVCDSLWNKVDILNYSDLMGLKKKKYGGVVMSEKQILKNVIMLQHGCHYQSHTRQTQITKKVCKGCNYNDGGVHAECIVWDKEENRKEFGDVR